MNESTELLQLLKSQLPDKVQAAAGMQSGGLLVATEAGGIYHIDGSQLSYLGSCPKAGVKQLWAVECGAASWAAVSLREDGVCWIHSPSGVDRQLRECVACFPLQGAVNPGLVVVRQAAGGGLWHESIDLLTAAVGGLSLLADALRIHATAAVRSVDELVQAASKRRRLADMAAAALCGTQHPAGLGEDQMCVLIEGGQPPEAAEQDTAKGPEGPSVELGDSTMQCLPDGHQLLKVPLRCGGRALQYVWAVVSPDQLMSGSQSSSNVVSLAADECSVLQALLPSQLEHCTALVAWCTAEGETGAVPLTQIRKVSDSCYCHASWPSFGCEGDITLSSTSISLDEMTELVATAIGARLVSCNCGALVLLANGPSPQVLAGRLVAAHRCCQLSLSVRDPAVMETALCALQRSLPDGVEASLGGLAAHKLAAWRRACSLMQQEASSLGGVSEQVQLDWAMSQTC